MAQTSQPTSSMNGDNNQFKIHIAVDFGTDGLGLAYAIDGEVFVHSQWKSKKYGVTEKPKTIILLDNEGEVNSFGMDAKFTYMNLKKKQKWMLFERFKMSLYQNKIKSRNVSNDNADDKKFDRIEINDMLTAVNGEQYPSEKVFVAAFSHIQSETKKFFRKQKIKVKKQEIEWILTVPAIWNDKAKYKMKQWIIKAGLVDENINNQCRIVYEPDCASLAIQHYIKQNTFNAANIEEQKGNDVDALDNKFKKGEKYILIDAGGGTVDIACHEILGEFGVKEIHHPSGGPWGSCYIDDQYVKLLGDIFGKQLMDEFKHKYPNVYIELMHDFQAAKATFYQHPTKATYNCRVPEDFISFMDDSYNEQSADGENTDIEDVVRGCKLLEQSNLVSLNEDYLTFNSFVWMHIFDHVMNPTIKHMKELLNQPKVMRNCKYLCLVGGLSCSAYFQSKMETEFGPKSKYKMQLIIPKRPILAVVQGAAYFGITENYIKARQVAKTYGVKFSVSVKTAKAKGVPQDFIEKNKFLDTYNNEHIVKNCFDVVVRKGEEVWTNQTIIREYIRVSTDKATTIKILCSDLSDPMVISGNNVMHMATAIIHHNATDAPNAPIIVEWHFYGTTLKVIYYLKKKPSNKKEMEIKFDVMTV